MARAKARPHKAGVVDYTISRKAGRSDVEKIELNSMPVTECGCWVWLQSLSGRGYAQLNDRGKVHRVHRLSYRAYKGDIPDGLHVLHTCDIRACVNPDHLYLGTDKENARDRIARGRQVNPPITLGEQNPCAKLTDMQVREILSLSENNCATARRFGVHPSTIWQIRDGRRRAPTQ